MANLRLADDRGLPRARRDPRGAPAAGRQRARRAASASSWRAAQCLHHPYRLPVIGWEHEIASYTPRGRDRVLPDVVRAQQRRADRRRRHRRRRAAAAGREAPTARSRRGRCPSAAGSRSRRSTPRGGSILRDAARPPAEPDPLLPGAQLHRRTAGSTPIRWRCWPRSWAAAATSRLYRALVVEQGLATGGRRLLSRRQPRRHHLPRLRQPAARRRDRRGSRRRSTPRSQRLLKDGVDRGGGDAGQAADAGRGRLRPRHPERRGAASSAPRLTTGRTVADVEGWPAKVAAVTAAEVAAAARDVLRPRALGAGAAAAGARRRRHDHGRRADHAAPGRRARPAPASTRSRRW